MKEPQTEAAPETSTGRWFRETYGNSRRLADFKAEAVDACIGIVQQSLDTTRAEGAAGDAEREWVKSSIYAREHVIRLLTGYREHLVQEPTPNEQ